MPTFFDSLPELSLGSGALILFGIVVLLLIIRGIASVLWGTATFCVAGLASFLTWQKVPNLVPESMASANWMPVAAAVAIFLLVMLAFRSVRKLFSFSSKKSSPLGIFGWVITLGLALIPTSALWLGGATLLHHFGSVKEIENYADNGQTEHPKDFWAATKDKVEGIVPSQWLALVNPAADAARVNLAKLLARQQDRPPRAIPVTEDPSVQQLMNENRDLQQLAREGRFSEILNDPRLGRILEDDRLRKSLSELDL